MTDIPHARRSPMEHERDEPEAFNLVMPEDIRSRAQAWGMEAFCEVLWNSAFQTGFREARRPRVNETPDPLT